MAEDPSPDLDGPSVVTRRLGLTGAADSVTRRRKSLLDLALREKSEVAGEIPSVSGWVFHVQMVGSVCEEHVERRSAVVAE